MISFSEFAAPYGGPTQVPDDKLYEFVLSVWDTVSRDVPEKIKETTLGKEVRRRAKQDLWFLSYYFLWSSSPWGAGQPITQNIFTEFTHRRIAEFFVKKDDSRNIAQQDELSKERILLQPRVLGKTTWDIADTIQWILNFPAIRILFLTAEDSLAEEILSETKGHFVRKAEKSWMNVFFDEYCINDEKTDLENKWVFTCPLWKAKQIKRREPTILASSIESTLSGKHFDILKVDDVVSNTNSETEEQCKKIAKHVNLAKKLLMPYGYVDFIGTRYQDEDLYGELIEKNVGDIKRTSGPCWELIENLTTGRKILIGRAWQLKPEAQAKLDAGVDALTGQQIKLDDFKKEDYDLIFPEVLTYEKLAQEKFENEFVFESQRNQNPRPAIKTAFDLPLLKRRTLPFGSIPFSGPISQTWDFAFSEKTERDYTTGATVRWNDKGEMFVIDLVRGHFKPAELAKAIVDSAAKWKPFVIGIEKAAGSQYLEPAIINEAIRTGDITVQTVCSKIDWIQPETQQDAKRSRIRALHPLLVHNQLAFAAFLPFLDVLYQEFQRCLLMSRSHDDIPDAIARQVRYIPRMVQMIAKKEIATWSLEDAAYNLMYLEGTDQWGRVGYAVPQTTVIPQEPDFRAETPSPDFEPILGAGLLG